MNKLIKFIVITLIFSFQYTVLAQGSWNIKYTNAKFINEQLIGKEVRLDFKSSKADSLNNKKVGVFQVRKLLSKSSTIDILIEEKFIKFKENWKLYPDHGILKEQSLLSMSDNLQIKEVFLISYTHDYITINAKIYTSTSDFFEKEIKVDRLFVKGVLTKN